MGDGRPHLDPASARRFHEIFSDDWSHQRGPLKETAATSAAARLALALGLDDDTVRRDHSGEGERVAKTLDGFLTDVSPAGIARAAAMAGGDLKRVCDPRAVAGLLARGINPVALMHFERVMAAEDAPTEHTVFDAAGMRNMLAVLPDGGAKRGIGHDYAMMQLADSTWWEGHELCLPVGTIPATLQVAASGRRIGDVLTHPLVDPDLRVAGFDDGHTMTTITFREPVRTATWREAVAAAAA